MLPIDLKNAIEEELRKASASKLKKASSELTLSYRSVDNAKKLTSFEQKLAYLAVRMPATFAAVFSVISHIQHLPLTSLLDIGAGPGTVSWALMEHQVSLQNSTLIEKDEELITLGKKLMGTYSTNVHWVKADMEKETKLPQSDLVTLSYSLGELPADRQIPLLLKAWDAAKKALVLIEPGTPRGFSLIRAARHALIDQGAYLLAPCPHAFECPIQKNDWCHFSKRLERLSFHREIKDVELPYEDEKFSYLIVTKERLDTKGDRILRHPQKRWGHIHFTACCQDGNIHSVVISRKMKERYVQAKKLEWGDLL